MVGALETVARAASQAAGLSFLTPLLESDVVKNSIVAAVRRSKKRQTQEAPTQFWASGSALLRLTKDQLRQLPTEVADIVGIFPNRTFSTPPISEVKQLPENVADNKASSWGVQGINALATWGAYDAKGHGVKVAVLDTGVDPSHPDLVGKISDWAEFDDQGRQVDSNPHDSGRHGTHVAGTVVGGGMSGRHIGVAPDAKVAAGLVLKGGSGTDAQILAGMQWAIELEVDVICMSLGGLRFGPDVFDTYTGTIISANQAGIPVIIAIGNEGGQTTGSPGNDFFAFGVGATDSRDRAAGFSGGRTQVIEDSRFIRSDFLPLVYSKPEVSAPGVAITSSVPGGDYATWNGTSMATPHVAGAVALLLSTTTIKSDVPASQRAFLIQDLLSGSVEELGEAGQDHRFGFGRIDALRMIGFAKERGF